MTARELLRSEIGRIWRIDRREVTENICYPERGKLISKPECHDMQGWPPGETERFIPSFCDCFARDG